MKTWTDDQDGYPPNGGGGGLGGRYLNGSRAIYRSIAG